jgi:REP element-mobilizing transposase RayT
MAIPTRNADAKRILSSSRTFFATTRTIQGRHLLQSERFALLLIDVLRSYVAAKKFTIHDFVVMPDHMHLLMTLDAKMSIEKAMQLIKGGFSYRRRFSLGRLGAQGAGGLRVSNFCVSYRSGRALGCRHGERAITEGGFKVPEIQPFSSLEAGEL